MKLETKINIPHPQNTSSELESEEQVTATSVQINLSTLIPSELIPGHGDSPEMVLAAGILSNHPFISDGSHRFADTYIENCPQGLFQYQDPQSQEDLFLAQRTVINNESGETLIIYAQGQYGVEYGYYQTDIDNMGNFFISSQAKNCEEESDNKSLLLPLDLSGFPLLTKFSGIIPLIMESKYPHTSSNDILDIAKKRAIRNGIVSAEDIGYKPPEVQTDSIRNICRYTSDMLDSLTSSDISAHLVIAEIQLQALDIKNLSLEDHYRSLTTLKKIISQNLDSPQAHRLVEKAVEKWLDSPHCDARLKKIYSTISF